MSAALARDEHSIRDQFIRNQGEMYGKKTAKDTQDRASSHVRMDQRQDGEHRLPARSQWRSVGLPSPRHERHRVEHSADDAAPELCKRLGVWEACDPRPRNPPVLCGDGEEEEEEQAASRRYGSFGLLSRQ